MSDTGREADGDRAHPNKTAFWDRPGFVAVVGGLLTLLAVAGLLAAMPDLLVRMLLLLSLSLLPLLAGAYALTLSLRLALSATLGLLFAFLWSLGALAFAQVRLDETAMFAVLAIDMVGAALTLALIALMPPDISNGANGRMAATLAATRLARPGSAAVLAVSTAVMALGIGGLLPLDCALVSSLGADSALALVLFWMLPALAGHMRFDETSIARLNHLGERRERMLLPLSHLAEKRWAFSGVGIAALLFAIAYGQALKFPTPIRPVLQHAVGLALALEVLAAGCIGVWAARDWRGFFLTALPATSAGLATGLIARQLGLAFAGLADLLLLVMGGSAGIAILLAGRLAAHRRHGEDFSTAFAQLVREIFAPLFCIGATSIIGALIFALGFAGALAAALGIAASVVALLIFLPLLARVLDTLCPARRPLEELYRPG